MPPAETLIAYEQVVPGSADRIFQWAEDSINTRNAAIDRTSKAEAKALTAGALSAAFFPYVMVIVALFGLITGHDVVAILGVLGTVAFAGTKIIQALKGRPTSDGEQD